MKLTINNVPFRLHLIAIILIGLGGCASFDKKEMVIQNYESVNSHPYSIAVNIGSGDEDSEVGLIPIPRQDLLYAIEESISKGLVFEKVVSGEEGDYVLNVTVLSLEQPGAGMGFNFTVKLEAGWTLTKNGGNIVWQKIIKSKHTATMSDAFGGAARFRMANDGAIRENIRQGMIKLSGLSI